MPDIWHEWLLERRFGGDRELMETVMEAFLYPLRDKVLEHAALAEGETLLDVGCGDGLIAFGALARTETGRVIFSDISQELLDHAAGLAQEMGVAARCRFVRAPAEDLSFLPDGAVDVVTTRSVLIYVKEKQAAFDEFYRVLRPGGRLSLFEPINRFGAPAPAHTFMGFDVTPVQEIAAKVRALYRELQPRDSDPMVDFDERDLLQQVEAAGFGTIELALSARIGPAAEPMQWGHVLHTAGNPKIPTLAEAMAQTLTPAERERFTAHLRPLVAANEGIQRRASAYLWATK